MVRPGLDSLNSHTEFSNVIRQSWSYKVVYLREAAWGGPGGACRAVWVAVVEGRTVSPDMLPISRYTAQVGKGDRRGWGVFSEELPVSKVIPKAVGSSEEGL